MSNDDSRTKAYQPTNVGDPVWSAKSAKAAADAKHDEEQRYADLLDTLKQIRDQVAHKNPDFARALGDEVGDSVVDAAKADTTIRKGQLKANIGGFEFTSVGSVDAAMRTGGAFSSGPVLQILSESTPHELAALREKAIGPERLGLSRPDDFSDEEYAKVVSTYAGAELLDRERQFNEAMTQKAHSREGWKMFLQVAIPILTLVLGSIATYFGMKD